MRPSLSVQTLLDGQFSRIGCWQLDERATLVLAGSAPDVPGVYAFVINGHAQYIGVASTSLAKRLYFYRKPGPTQKTNIRMNAALREALAGGRSIDVFVATPPTLDWNGWRVSGPEGLEAGIIKDYDLPWNLRGSTSKRVSTSSPSAAASSRAPERAHVQLATAHSAPRPASGGKYRALCEFLRGCQQEKVSMTFARIEQLVGPLPKSAGLHRAWWANHEGNTQARGWMPARYLAEPDMAHRTVVFSRFTH